MIDSKQFESLLEYKSNKMNCVSIYIPTYRVGNAQEDRIRLKNALTEAANQLSTNTIFQNNEMNQNDVDQFLAPAFGLLEDKDFWNHLSEGLVLFIGENHFSYFAVPIDFQAFVYIHDHFYLRHLIPLVDKNNRFFVLALSQNSVRFFEANSTSITPVIIEDLVPLGIEELVDSSDNTSNLQRHSGGTNADIYHGHGGGKDDKDKELKKYFRSVDDGLMKMLFDEKAPMIIYSVDYQIPIYKEISNYSNIHDTNLVGNPESDDPALIHERAWLIMDEYFKAQNQISRDTFNQNLVDNKASFSILDIAPAAIHGKVDTLFLDKGEAVEWGHYDEEKHTIKLHMDRLPDSTCLLNKAAVATFKNGGTIFNYERKDLPSILSGINAIFRY